jgi:hypothetical protein
MCRRKLSGLPLKLIWPGRRPARAPSIRELMPEININPGIAIVRPPGSQDQDSVLIICKPLPAR